jgi:hypothetical protein
MRRRLQVTLAAAAAAVSLAAGAPGAAAVPPAPFGHACVPAGGALRCAPATPAERVPSFDGTPIDVDVWLPPAGDGPFPTVAMLHGFGQSKTAFSSGGRYSAPALARAGYAVVLPTARGFDGSCGRPELRTADCARGYVHLADQRYEVRDVQHLLGLLVDQGVADAGALGATGISYGGGTSLQLATLRDRVRLPGGAYAAWTSPAGRRLRIAAAWPRWPWSDLADALVPNGRLLQPGAGPEAYRAPVGVPLQAWIGTLYAVASGGFLAAPGADPSADLTGWKALTDRGEPLGPEVRAALREMHAFHGAQGLALPRGGGAPLLLQAGWTDDLFPVGQALRAYVRRRRAAPRALVALQVGNIGHPRAGNAGADVAAFDRQGVAFLDAVLRGRGRPPRPGAVTAYGQGCPRSRTGVGPYRARSWATLSRGTLRFGAARTQRVTSTGGDAALAERLDPVTLDACTPLPAGIAPRTAVATVRSRGVTLLGRTTITARVGVRGRFAQLVGRLWDVDGARQRLVDRAVVRLGRGSRLRFALNGNGWRFARGHRIRLELVGRDAPAFRPSNTPFSVTVRDLRVALPRRSRPRSARRAARPPPRAAATRPARRRARCRPTAAWPGRHGPRRARRAARAGTARCRRRPAPP